MKNGIQITRNMLPEGVVSFHGTDIPVFYKGELRKIVDVNYSFYDLVYLKNNSGVPVPVSELSIKKEWEPLLKAIKEECDFVYRCDKRSNGQNVSYGTSKQIKLANKINRLIKKLELGGVVKYRC